MCGRYVSTSGLAELAEAYEVDEVRTEALEPRWNVAPSQPIYAVVGRRRPDEEGEEGTGKGLIRVLGTFRWGLVPSWAGDRSVGNRMINARAEGIATKPAFRSALVRRRCVIPADAFYEWQARPPGPDGAKRGRLPHVARRRDGRPLSLAGLWEVWRDPDDPDAPPLRTATIVTTAANGPLCAVHARMPVVLAGAGLATWLDPAVDDPAALTGLLVPAPDDGWEVFAVGTRVNAVANDGPDLLEPLPAGPGVEPTGPGVQESRDG